MTQEEKRTLLVDLCARLPYGLKFDAGTVNPIHTLQTIYTDAETHVVEFMDEIGFSFELNDFKPYLRPMSSMTKEEKKTYLSYCECDDGDYTGEILYFNTIESFDYLNQIHVDYRNLIPRGLALEAPEGMYVIK